MTVSSVLLALLLPARLGKLHKRYGFEINLTMKLWHCLNQNLISTELLGFPRR
jgi:hypothetical protein